MPADGHFAAVRRDALLTALMALSIAAVPNLLQLAAWGSGARTAADKLTLIGAIALGAATGGVVFACAARRARSPGPKVGRASRKQLAALSGFGILASCYFVAVVGLGAHSGFGPGVAETIDSGLAPCIYVAVFHAAAVRLRRNAVASPTGLPPRVLGGAALVFLGFGGIALAIALSRSDATPWTFEDSLLCGFAVAGAAGTALSLWLTRRLVRGHGTAVGRAVAWRYGGPALVFLLAGAVLSPDIHPAWTLVCLAGGAVLINGAFVFATRIANDHAAAAGLGLTPLVALGLEFAINALGVGQSDVPLDSPWLWLGVAVAAAGIATLQNERAANDV